MRNVIVAMSIAFAISISVAFAYMALRFLQLLALGLVFMCALAVMA